MYVDRNKLKFNLWWQLIKCRVLTIGVLVKYSICLWMYYVMYTIHLYNYLSLDSCRICQLSWKNVGRIKKITNRISVLAYFSE